MKRATTILALASLLAACPAAAQVTSGRLSATTATDPWKLSFQERGVGTILSESSGRGRGPTGSLGFSTAAGWWHATRVLSGGRSGRSFVARLATTDPLGRSLAVRIDPESEGVIRLSASVEGSTGDVEATGIAFSAPRGERYLGFGERSNAVDQRGANVENFVAEGPYQPEERPFFSAFIPPAGYHPRDDATYFPMPWLLSTAGYGVLVGNLQSSLHRLGTDDPGAWSVEASAPNLTLRVFAGPRPADVVRRLTRFTGRQPPVAAAWWLGPWFQPRGGIDEQLEDVRTLRQADAPVSAANTFLHYLPCGDQVGRRPDERRRTRGMHAEGLAVTAYFNPMLCSNYQPVFGQAAARGALLKNGAGQPYTYRYTSGIGPDREFQVGQFDFSARAGNELYEELLSEAVEDGHDGWMEDFGEYTPIDSRSANGMGGDQMHNLHPVLYHRASYEFARRQSRPVAGYIRSGWTGVHPYAQLVWGGDPTTDWGYDGLTSAVRNGLTMGLSGISRWGSATGGFFALGTRQLSPELLKRWIEFASVSGIMRTEATGVELPPKPRPQIPDKDILPVWRRYAKLRTQLYPYLVAAEAEYQRTGLPVMRHMALAYPNDAEARERDDQFMFGPDLLVAPVLGPGRRTRRPYLPAGSWIDLWRTATYVHRTGELRLGRARLVSGGRRVTLPAPLDELPLLVRAGSVLPLLPSDVDTLAGYGRGGRAVRLADRRRRLVLLAFPRGRSTSRFGERGLLRSRERRRRWALRIRGRRGTRYRLRASMVTLRRPFRPRCLKLGRRRFPRRAWRYDRQEGVLYARFKTRRRSSLLRASPKRCPRKSKRRRGRR